MDDNEVAIAFPLDEYHAEEVIRLMMSSKINYGDFKFVPIQYNTIMGEYLKDFDTQLETKDPHIVLVIQLGDNVKHEQIKKWFESEGFNVVGMSKIITYIELKNGVELEYIYES